MAENKSSCVYFIDRLNYAALQGKEIDLTDISKLVVGDCGLTNVSQMTKAYVLELNRKLYKALFDSYYFSNSSYVIDVGLTDREITYVRDSVKDYLTNRDNCEQGIGISQVNGLSVNADFKPEEYYEIINLGDNLYSDNLLVIVKQGFFNILTKSKEDLKKFFLDCLRVQYQFGFNLEPLLRNYLSLQINEGSFDLTKLRIE